MEKLIVIAAVLISFCAGCSIINSNDSLPEFVENLYERENVPDSLGIQFQIEIKESESDTLNISLFVANTSEDDVILTHSGSYANFVLFKGSEIIYPTFDLDKLVYTDDYNESPIQAKTRIQVMNMKMNLPNKNRVKIVAFAPFRVLQNFCMTNEEEYWLVSDPIDISRY